ncbi:MAG: VIT family protein [Actinomycetaceae bacterium]|nr:VIT family protein [Actinomycetaceae bacterium]
MSSIKTTSNEHCEDDFEIIAVGQDFLGSRLNWLRAGVLGANDGIVSTAGIVMGVSGAAASSHTLLISGVAGLVAGALSMAAGEYVSVSTQRDAERAAVAKKRSDVANDPRQAELRLAGLIAGSGISRKLALQVSRELSSEDPVAAHVHYEYGIDAEEFTNPWHAAWASMFAFILGAIIPLFAILLSPTAIAPTLTVIAVSIALAVTGSVSAKLGGAPIIPATWRNILWGNIAMAVTYGVGAVVALITG